MEKIKNRKMVIILENLYVHAITIEEAESQIKEFCLTEPQPIVQNLSTEPSQVRLGPALNDPRNDPYSPHCNWVNANNTVSQPPTEVKGEKE